MPADATTRETGGEGERRAYIGMSVITFYYYYHLMRNNTEHNMLSEDAQHKMAWIDRRMGHCAQHDVLQQGAG